MSYAATPHYEAEILSRNRLAPPLEPTMGNNPGRNTPLNRTDDTCLCGTPLVRCRGHRTRQFCSDRCRQQAHRKRQTQISSRLALSQKLKQQARREQAHKRVQRSRQLFVWRDAQTCPCGTPLVQERGHRPRESCSDRCRKPGSSAAKSAGIMKRKGYPKGKSYHSQRSIAVTFCG